MIRLAIRSRRTFSPNFLIWRLSSVVRGTRTLQDETQLDRYDMPWRNPPVAKNRDFLDYVSITAQLVEAANSGAIRDHLGTLSRLEAEKLSAAQREAFARERERRVRDLSYRS